MSGLNSNAPIKQGCVQVLGLEMSSRYQLTLGNMLEQAKFRNFHISGLPPCLKRDSFPVDAPDNGAFEVSPANPVTALETSHHNLPSY